MKYKFVLELAGGGKIFSHNFDNDFRSQFTPFAGLKFYFSNPRFSERSYFGTGFFYEGQSVIDSTGVTYWNYKIPITYSYSSPKKGISPTVSAGMNIRNYQDYLFTSVSVTPGLKFNFRTFYINLYVDFEFGSIYLIPRGYHSTNFGLSLNYKIN